MKPNLWDAVIVYWVDSSGLGSWTDAETIYNDTHIAHCWTCGFYFGDSGECIRIVGSASDNDSIDHVMYIPVVAVKKIEILRKAQEK